MIHESKIMDHALAALADKKGHDPVRFVGLINQKMALLAAEMGKIDTRRGIIGANHQLGTGAKRREALSCLQHRQRAEKPRCIKLGIDRVGRGHGPTRSVASGAAQALAGAGAG